MRLAVSPCPSSQDASAGTREHVSIGQVEGARPRLESHATQASLDFSSYYVSCNCQHGGAWTPAPAPGPPELAVRVRRSKTRRRWPPSTTWLPATMSSLLRVRGAVPSLRTGVRAYSSPAAAPKPRRLGRKLVFYTVSGTGAFYGLSVIASAKSERYADFFAENVPYGARTLDFFETHNIDDAVNAARTVGQTIETGVEKTKSVYAYLTGERAEDDADAIVVAPAVKGPKTPKQDVAKGDLRVEPPIPAPAPAPAPPKEQPAPSKADTLAAKAKDAAHDAKAKLGLDTSQKDAPQKEDKPVGLVAHSPGPGDRRLNPEEAPAASLRPPPGAIKLPSLAGSVTSGPAEPVIRELASTIDELAAVVAATPAGTAGSTRAAGALREAQADLKKLTARVDEIKVAEQKRLDKELKALQSKYEVQLKTQHEAAVRKAGESDAAWETRLNAQSKALQAEAEKKLTTELTSQAALIHERLYNEVVAQGVALQKRWIDEIGQRVEQERGARLARLDDLAKQVSTLQDATAAEAKARDDASRLRQLQNATSALELATLAPGESAAAPPQAFREELRALKQAVVSVAQADGEAHKVDSVLLHPLLDWLDGQPAPDTGVASAPYLNVWFVDRVAPALLGASLVPPEAGPIAHATSAVLGPLLSYNSAFTRNNQTAAAVAIARNALEHNQLATATAALTQLEGWPALIAQDWLAAARTRLEVQQAIEAIKTESRFESLLLA